MAAGNTILARDTDSNREVADDAALYWRTPDELGALLREVWPDHERRLRLGRCAQERARELYDWDQVTTRYIDLCERSLG